MNNPLITHPFKPIIDKEATVLILGSFPSVTSRQDDFYYMHPQNRFWKILTAIYGDDFVDASVREKKRLLHKHGIALYDVIEQCRIEQSADHTITDAAPADIPSLIENTHINKILLNGRSAERLFLSHHPRLGKTAVYVPSSSPANARYSLDDLIRSWKKALEES